MPRGFDAVKSARDLKRSIEAAIENLIDEVKRPIDTEASGSARKAELQLIKQAAIDCRELMQERQRVETMIKELSEIGTTSEEKDYGTGFAEEFAK